VSGHHQTSLGERSGAGFITSDENKRGTNGVNRWTARGRIRPTVLALQSRRKGRGEERREFSVAGALVITGRLRRADRLKAVLACVRACVRACERGRDAAGIPRAERSRLVRKNAPRMPAHRNDIAGIGVSRSRDPTEKEREIMRGE